MRVRTLTTKALPRSNRAGLLAYLVGVQLGVTSCFEGPSLFKQKESIRAINAHEVFGESNEGVLTATISDNTVAQLVRADEDSEISGTSIEFPPGALAIGSSISIQAAGDIATASTFTGLGLSSDIGVSQTTAAVMVTNSANTNAASPFTLALGLPSSSSLTSKNSLGLTADDYANLIVVYKTFDPETGNYRVGIITRADITIKDGKAVVSAISFGAYQTAIMSQPVVEAPKEVVTDVPILSRQEEKVLPPIVWTQKVVAGDSRSAVFSFNITGMADIVRCVAIQDQDKVAPWTTTDPVAPGTSYTVKAASDAAQVAYVSFSCTDKAGRESGTSPWLEYTFAAVPKDLTPPPAPTISSSTSLTGDTRPTWNWVSGGSDGNGKFRYKLDSNDFSNVTETTAKTFRPAAGLSDGTHILYVQERDNAGNWSQSGTSAVTIDTTAPVVVLTSNTGTTTNLSTIVVTATFSEPVTGFQINKVTATGGTVNSLSGSGSVYTFNLVASGDGTVTVSVLAQAATDAIGLQNAASTVLTRQVVTSALTATVTSAASSPTQSTPLPYTVTFNRSVTGFTSAKVNVTNGTVSSFSGSGATYNLSVTPTAPGNVSVSVNASVVNDSAGNSNAASNMVTKIFDNVSPAPGNSGTINISNIADTYIDFDWVLASDNITSSGVLEYSVFRSLSNNISTVASAESNGTVVLAYTANQLSKSATGLTPGTSYYFAVVVKDEAGNKAIYSIINPTTTDVTPPTPGGGSAITIDSVDSTSIAISWATASDNVSAPSNLSYRVYYSISNNITGIANAAASGTPAGSWTPNISSFNVTGLASNTTYYLTVIVEDQAANQESYVVVSTTTLPPDLTCDIGSLAGNCTINTSHNIPNGAVVNIVGDLTISTGGGVLTTLNPDDTFTLSVAGNVIIDGAINANVILDGANILVSSTGQINADNRGYPGGVGGASGSGPGGGVGSGSNAGAGGGHGGAGGNNSTADAAGGATYDSTTNPALPGSGGGAGGNGSNGGAGGGFIQMIATSQITIDGLVTANGAPGSGDRGGGGAGGSIYIDAPTGLLGNTNGLLAARGGAGMGTPGYGGGGGGGGIIAYNGTVNRFQGKIQINGGEAIQGGAPGQDGSFDQTSSLVCDVGTPTTSCQISNPVVIPAGTYAADDIILNAGGMIRTPLPSDELIFELTNNLTVSASGAIHANLSRVYAANISVAAGGTIDASGMGYHFGGPNAGTSGVSGGGGGQGGAGGAGNGGGAGGSANSAAFATEPTELGSAGGDVNDGITFGGAGGGRIKLVAINTISIAGNIAVNGINGANGGSGGAGGGAGGSIFLFGHNVDVSGTVDAQGGNGGTGSNGGGGGGGGRIAIYYKTTGGITGTNIAGGAGGTSGGSSGSAGTYIPQVLGTDFNKVFVTNGTFNGNLGGIAGADTSCTTAATAASISAGTTWKALLSDDTTAASTLNSTLPIFNLAGESVAAASQLWSGALTNSILYTELLEPISDAFPVWTGTTTAGASVAGYTCSDWTSPSAGFQGKVGDSSLSTSAWIYNGTADTCDNMNHLYCLSQ